MAPRVLVTRPRREAEDWVRALRDRGIDASALPLIDIAPPVDRVPLMCAWRTLSGCTAVMFVSANAVDGFFAAVPGGVWPAGTSAWATGPGTAAALQRAGVPQGAIACPASDAAQFDSEALWERVQADLPPAPRVIIVRGDDAGMREAGEGGRLGVGRDWLAAQITGRGGVVDMVVSYVRRAPLWDAAEQARADSAARDGTLWLFSSSEALRHLRQLLPDTSWQHARAIATHERIARAVLLAGFAVCTVCRPALDDLVASIESMA